MDEGTEVFLWRTIQSRVWQAMQQTQSAVQEAARVDAALAARIRPVSEALKDLAYEVSSRAERRAMEAGRGNERAEA